ncbi:MAG: aminodeoxychorismate synthase, component I [Haloferacaceae archaeon]
MRLVTDRDAFRRAASGADGARVPVEVRHRVPDPFVAYRRARDGSPSVHLETTGGQPGWGYFATDPVEFVERAAVGDDALGGIAAAIDGESLVRGDCGVPYPCGAIGWLSYDAARELEDLPATTVDDRGLPLLQLGIYDRVAAWPEPRDGPVDLRVCACPTVGADADAAYDRGVARARDLVAAIRNGDPAVGAPPADAGHATFGSDAGREAFRERVRRVKAHVRAGETFQANVSQRLRGPAAVHPVEAFAALRRVNPAPYSALVEFPGVDLVSASPELLLSVTGDRVLTEPIAGTRPRGAARSIDAALEADMLADGKERAEHAMLVDLERNDLGKVCRFGSVGVSEYRRVDRYAEVMHLVSVVEGRLRDDRTTVDAVAAAFPGGTITGAPKPRTMGIIDEVEATRRGPYTGSVGLFGFDGRATLSILIRTLVRHADEYHLRVGAGIVHDSDPDAEYEETLDKGRALVDAVDAALEGRDLAVERGGKAESGVEGEGDGRREVDR